MHHFSRICQESCSDNCSFRVQIPVHHAVYVLMCGIRRLALAGMRHTRAQCSTLRVRYLKIAAQVRVTARRVWLALSENYPWQADFERAARRLLAHPCILYGGQIPRRTELKRGQFRHHSRSYSTYNPNLFRTTREFPPQWLQIDTESPR